MPEDLRILMQRENFYQTVQMQRLNQVIAVSCGLKLPFHADQILIAVTPHNAELPSMEV